MIKRILDGKKLFMEEDAERAQKEQEHMSIRELERMIKKKSKEVEEPKEKELEGNDLDGRRIEYDIV